MSGRKKGKKAMSGAHGDPPEVSGYAPGYVDYQDEGELNDTSALYTNNNLLPPMNMADRVPTTTTAPAGNAYEQQWGLIRPDRDASTPQGQPNRYLASGSHQLGARPIDASGMFLLGKQGQDTSSSQIPLATSFKSPLRLPTLSYPVPHPTQASAPPGMANTSTPPQQIGTANTFPGLPSGLQWPLPHNQLSGPAGGVTSQVDQAGQGGFPSVPGQGHEDSTEAYPLLTQLPKFRGSQFSGPRAIEEYLRKPVWRPYPLDWMLPDEVELWRYVAKVYNGIIDLRNVCDRKLGYVALFRPGERWSDPKEIEAISYVVVMHAIKIHQHGVTNFKFKAPERVRESDRSLTFSQRIHFVVILLTHFKMFANEFMTQRRLEDIIANIHAFLFQQKSFELWWERMSEDQQKKCMFVDPYDGMVATHPTPAQYDQWRAMSEDVAVSNPSVSATAGQQQGGHDYPAPTAHQAPVVPGDPASQQHPFQAGSTGSDQHSFQILPEPLGRRLDPDEDVRYSGPASKRQRTLTALDTMAPTRSDNLLRTRHPTLTATESEFQNPTAQHDPDFGHLYAGYGYPGTLDSLGSSYDPLWQPAGLQDMPGSGHGHGSAFAQSVENAVPEGAGKPVGGDAEGRGERSEGEDEDDGY